MVLGVRVGGYGGHSLASGVNGFSGFYSYGFGGFSSAKNGGFWHFIFKVSTSVDFSVNGVNPARLR